MRAVVLTFYDESAFGPRSIVANARLHGHEVDLINFKRFVVKAIPREGNTEREDIDKSGHRPVWEVHPYFDAVCPYPTEVTQNEKDILFAKLKDIDPGVIGFALTSAHLPLVEEISTDLRKRHPNAKQIWGGIHPTMTPKTCLEFADAVCSGEGDDAFVDYLNDPTRTDIGNLHLKDKDGSYIVNPLRPLIQNLDEYPLPAYTEGETLIDDDRDCGPTDFSRPDMRHLMVLNSQRGCPFDCTYCLHSNLRDLYKGEKYLRRKSVDFFLDEIELRVKQFNLEAILLWDDILMIGPRWIEEFCEKYPKRIGLPFGGYCHPNTTSRRIMDNLVEAGAYYVLVGVQSGSPYMTKEIYDRHTTRERYIKFGQDLKDSGFQEIIYELLTDTPFEREEDLMATVDLLSQLPKAARVHAKQLVLYPHSKIALLDKPKYNLDPKIHFFYDMLFLLSGVPGFDVKMLPALARDAHLREHPELVETWVRELTDTAEANKQIRRENRTLKDQIDSLEDSMPWGIRRSTSHLVDQVKNRFNRMTAQSSMNSL